jgi:hypothetical protein
MRELQERLGGTDVIVEEADIDTLLETDVTDTRSDTGRETMAVVDGDRQALLCRCVPDGCQLCVLDAKNGLTATLRVPDRAPQKSIAGGMTVTLRWEPGNDVVAVNGETVPLSQLKTKLEAYDRSVNWSAIQGMHA